MMIKPIFCLLFLFLSLGVYGDGFKKVVSLAPAFTEIVFFLGKGDLLVGRTSACDYPAEATKIPIAGNFAEPEMEKLLRLRPDLVLANVFANPTLIKTLENAGITVELLPCNNIVEYRAVIERMGELLDCREEASKELRRIDDKLAKLEKMAPLGHSGLFVIWDSPLMAAGKGSLSDEIMRHAGIANIAGLVEQQYFKCSFDWVLKNQPDLIIWTMPYSVDVKHRFWSQLVAVKNGRIISGIDPDLISRPGPRMFDGIEMLRAKAVEAMAK